MTVKQQDACAYKGARLDRVDQKARAIQTALRVLKLADAGEWTPTQFIATRIGCHAATVPGVIERLRASGVEVERAPGNGGGYRLVRKGDGP